MIFGRSATRYAGLLLATQRKIVVRFLGRLGKSKDVTCTSVANHAVIRCGLTQASISMPDWTRPNVQSLRSSGSRTLLDSSLIADLLSRELTTSKREICAISTLFTANPQSLNSKPHNRQKVGRMELSSFPCARRSGKRMPLYKWPSKQKDVMTSSRSLQSRTIKSSQSGGIRRPALGMGSGEDL